MKIASEKNIPFVALAFSPDQATFFKYSKEELTESWIPKEMYNEPFDENDRKYFWNPENIEIEKIPQFILPFYAIDYPGSEKIINKINELGLGSKKDFNPISSNCDLLWLLMRLDIKINNFNPFMQQLSDQIRQGKTNYKKWVTIVKLGTIALRYGLVKRKEIKQSLDFLNMDFKDIKIPPLNLEEILSKEERSK